MQIILENVKKIIDISLYDPPPPSQMIEQVFPILHLMMENMDVNILTRTVKLLICLMKVSNQQDMQFVSDGVIVLKLNNLMLNDHALLKLNALRAVVEIAYRLTEHRKLLLDFNLLQHFSTLLTDTNGDVRKKSMFSLSRFLEFEETSSKAVNDGRLLPIIREILISNEFQMKVYAASAVRNILSGSNEEYLKKLVQADVISPFCELIELDATEITKVRKSKSVIS